MQSESPENVSPANSQSDPAAPGGGGSASASAPPESGPTAPLPSPLCDRPVPQTPGSDPQVSTLGLQPPFLLFPGETPRAFSAFMAFFQLGHARSLQAVADQLDESLSTTKKWSSKFRWSGRIQSFNAGLLQQQAEAEAASRQQQAADWARRTAEQREQDWAASQKLRAAAQCFLESFGDREVSRMTLAQVSRALTTSSRLARLALSGATGPEEPVLAPLQLELAAALKRAYAQPPPPTLNPQPSTLN
jgi:hypothetical protein